MAMEASAREKPFDRAPGLNGRGTARGWISTPRSTLWLMFLYTARRYVIGDRKACRDEGADDEGENGAKEADDASSRRNGQDRSPCGAATRDARSADEGRLPLWRAPLRLGG